MTTPNSLLPQQVTQPGPVPVTVTVPSVNPMDALAASYDVQDVQQPVTIPPQTKPVVSSPSQPSTSAGALPVEQPVPSPAAPEQKHPTWLVDKATNVLGMHPLLLERLDTDSLTRVVMDGIASRLAESSQRSRMEAVANPNPPGMTDPAVAAAAVAASQNGQPAKPQTPAEPAWDWGEHQAYDEYGNPIAGKKVKYTDEMINPALAHWIKNLEARLKKAEQFNESVQSRVATNQIREFENQFDAAFSKYPKIYGSGTAAEAKKDPAAFERRKVAFAAVKGMFQSLPPEIAGSMTIEQGVANMTKTLFGADPPVAAANGNTLPPGHPGNQFAQAGLAQPSQRQGNPMPHGEARAKAAVSEWWDAHKNDGVSSDGATSPDEFL